MDTAGQVDIDHSATGEGANLTLEASTVGCLLGCAVGDAVGLPREGLPVARARRIFGPTIRQQLLFGHSTVSDDTEHLLMTACALIEAGGSFERFQHGLARRLRMWIALVPPAAGLSTIRGCFWLLLYVSPERSGVPSAGNGPLMRAPVIGLYLAHDIPRLRRFVRASTRLTHTDPRAERAAQLVALAAGWHLRTGQSLAEATPEQRLAELVTHVPEPDEELAGVLARARDPEPLDAMWPRGVSGYAYHSLLAILHTWLHHGSDYRRAVETVINLGGDTDTTAAVVGALVGASAGPESLPEEWVRGLWDWPRNVGWIARLGQQLADPAPEPPVRCPSWHPGASLLRNLGLLVIVLGHGFYRLFRLGGRI